MPNNQRNDDREKPIPEGSWTHLFPKDHITADDLWNQQTGRYNAVTVTIDRIVLKGLFDPQLNRKVDKPVIFFKGKEKYLILNVEISKQLAEITGRPEVNSWAGTDVEIYVHIGRNTPQGPMDVPRLRTPSRGGSSQQTRGQQQPRRTEPAPARTPEFTGSQDDTPF